MPGFLDRPSAVGYRQSAVAQQLDRCLFVPGVSDVLATSGTAHGVCLLRSTIECSRTLISPAR